MIWRRWFLFWKGVELTVDGMKDGGKGDGVLQRERETASSRGPAAQRRSCFLPFSSLFFPFLSLLTPPSHFSSRFPFAFHALLPIATTPLPPSILANLFHQFYCFYPAFLSIESPPFLFSFVFLSRSFHISPIRDSPLRSPNSPRNLPTSGAPVTFQIV